MALIALIAPNVTGCSNHPAGFSGPRQLTDSEKEVVTELGVKAAGFPTQVQTNFDLTWTVIIWNGSQKKEVRYLPADISLSKAVEGLTAAARWYPAVIVSVAGGGEWVQVTVDLATRKVIDRWSKPKSIVPP